MVKVKRIYDSPSKDDGKRILVDRLWPRGIKKEKAMLHEWLRDIAPSTELRKWFSHDPSRWQEFEKRYRKELLQKPVLLERLKEEANKGTITLLFGARDSEHNNAVALKSAIIGKRQDKVRRNRSPRG